ncbi:isocitrate lyase/phosphoenolpyruvate mutase family protein [Bacillus sp. NP157]|nr:isocitrate lyase/phosphoenolpyruvate mutase family protein [Bacillus sp. NP157]
MSPSDRYQAFLALHARPGAFAMPNAWDATSALIFKDAGFEAIGTSSAALAASLGRPDGRHAVSLQEHLDHAQLLGRVTGLPINGDFEDGYGDTPDDVAASVRAAIDAGLAGIGIEDTSGDPNEPIRPFDEAVARMAAAAKVAKGRIVLTGRTDNYLQGRPDLDDTIRRLTAFAEVGADVLYAPYPSDLDHVIAIVRAVAPKPVNLVVGTMQGPLSMEALAAAGVKRVSIGAGFYARVMGDLREAARQLRDGDVPAATEGASWRDIAALIATVPG